MYFYYNTIKQQKWPNTIIIITNTLSTQWQQTVLRKTNTITSLVYSNLNDLEMILEIITTIYNKHLNVG